MSEWRSATVAELEKEHVLLVQDGNHGNDRPLNHEFTSVGTPFIRAADIRHGRALISDASRINESALARIRKGHGRAGDTLFSHKGTVGKIAYVPEGTEPFVCSPQTTFWRSTDQRVLNPRFLPYVLESPGVVSQVDSMKGETDMAPYVSLTQQRQLRVAFPSLPEQTAICDVLGALDDKVAANTALARVATQLASSEFAILVRGVGAGPTFDQVATVSGGGTPSTANLDFWEGGVPWATPTDMTALAGPYLNATSRSISEAGLAACSSKLFEPGAILMTSRATIGAIAVNTIPTAVNQGFIVVEPHDDRLRWWLFHEMESRVEEFISWANGATFLELSRGNFKRLSVRVPADDVVDSFAARASALHDRARAALEENRTLAATRDALLPQLMSGKLGVRDAEAIAANAGA